MPNTTYLIPLQLDSIERRLNVETTIRYLLKHTDGKIMISEAGTHPWMQDLGGIENSNGRIIYSYERLAENGNFHRTRMINEMLHRVDTPYVANYDADVLLPPETYGKAEAALEGGVDVLYPYGFEEYDQREFSTSAEKAFLQSLNVADIPIENLNVLYCRFGHVQFFVTDVYRSGYMENENYLHGTPEDEERGHRFRKLGYNVQWQRGLVYHQKHPIRKSTAAPDKYLAIMDLHQRLLAMSPDQLREYYNQQPYIKKYEPCLK